MKRGKASITRQGSTVQRQKGQGLELCSQRGGQSCSSSLACLVSANELVVVVVVVVVM